MSQNRTNECPNFSTKLDNFFYKMVLASLRILVICKPDSFRVSEIVQLSSNYQQFLVLIPQRSIFTFADKLNQLTLNNTYCK